MQHELRRSLSSALIAAVGLVLLTAPNAPATEKVLYRFSGSDGAGPQAGLTLDGSGNLYGTTVSGGAYGAGCVFELTPSSNGTWTEKVIYSFAGFTSADGALTFGGLVFDTKGNLYGATALGGTFSAGTVFQLTPQSNGTWAEKVLYSFTGGTDGSFSYSGVTLDGAGNLYGTTETGGTGGFGTVFELLSGSDGTWTEKTLHSFMGGNDGGNPYIGQLIFDNAGHLYGSAPVGGAHDYGVIFQLSPGSNGSWTENIVHAFTGGSDGISGLGTLAFDRAGSLYSTAVYTVVKFTPASNGIWYKKDVHYFAGGNDGASAEGSLTFDKFGNLYGTTSRGGVHLGTVFELSPQENGTWTENILHKFTGGNDGIYPLFSTLTVDAKGNVYGTTSSGGPSNAGVVFEVQR
jgi:uncharacterized repeat protein (TIGR03803 family)